MKKANRKGFTLAELLIVVAIIAVLVGIAIPVFRNKAEKAREAYDIYTMRQAASAAIEFFYMGLNETNASSFGFSWSGSGSRAAHNIYAAYDPSSGKFYPSRGALPGIATGTGYGKGTSIDAGTNFILGNTRGAYASTEKYTGAVVMVAIYPYADPPRLDVYWKNNGGSYGTEYVGKQYQTNIPKYSISIPLN